MATTQTMVLSDSASPRACLIPPMSRLGWLEGTVVGLAGVPGCQGVGEAGKGHRRLGRGVRGPKTQVTFLCRASQGTPC